MIRRLLPALALLATAAGCQSPPDLSPPVGRGDPYLAPENDPRLAVLSPELRPWLGFQMPLVRYDDERPLLVEVPVRNLTERRYLVDWRVRFFDANGFEIDPVMGWEMAAFEPKQTLRLSRNALGNDARDWKLEIKWAK